MKVVYVKYIDPTLWNRPDEVIYEEDIELIDLMIVRIAGILIKEDESKLILGEVQIEEDNPTLSEWDIKFPRYRYVAVINKRNILQREDFEIAEITNKDGTENGN